MVLVQAVCTESGDNTTILQGDGTVLKVGTGSSGLKKMARQLAASEIMEPLIASGEYPLNTVRLSPSPRFVL